jgi:hypothetical protein
MNALTLTHALEHARQSLSLAQARLELELPPEEPPSQSYENAERRVRAQVAKVAGLLESTSPSDAAASLESAANDLDRELTAFDEALEAEEEA